MKTKSPNKEFVKAIKKKVRKDFGKPCKDFNWYCATCSANMAVQILEDLYED
jgi:hypothetical protein